MRAEILWRMRMVKSQIQVEKRNSERVKIERYKNINNNNLGITCAEFCIGKGRSNLLQTMKGRKMIKKTRKKEMERDGSKEQLIRCMKCTYCSILYLLWCNLVLEGSKCLSNGIQASSHLQGLKRHDPQATVPTNVIFSFLKSNTHYFKKATFAGRRHYI